MNRKRKHKLLAYFLEYQEHLCLYCECLLTRKKGVANSATLEHRLAKARGGSDDPANLAATCVSCNNAKGDLSEEDFMELMRGNY